MNYDSDLPREARELLQSVMLRDEKLCWTGIPRPFFFRKEDVPMFVFGIVWTLLICPLAFSIISNVQDVPIMVYIFITPFILIGVGLLSVPLFTYRRAQKTFYALTNKRAIIVTPRFFSGHTINCYDLEEGVIKEQIRQADGSGDLIFRYEAAFHLNHTPVMRSVGFLKLPNIQEVVERIYRILQERKESEP